MIDYQSMKNLDDTFSGLTQHRQTDGRTDGQTNISRHPRLPWCVAW